MKKLAFVLFGILMLQACSEPVKYVDDIELSMTPKEVFDAMRGLVSAEQKRELVALFDAERSAFDTWVSHRSLENQQRLLEAFKRFKLLEAELILGNRRWAEAAVNVAHRTLRYQVSHWVPEENLLLNELAEVQMLSEGNDVFDMCAASKLAEFFSQHQKLVLAHSQLEYVYEYRYRNSLLVSRERGELVFDARLLATYDEYVRLLEDGLFSLRPALARIKEECSTSE